MQEYKLARDFGTLSYYKEAQNSKAPVILGISGFGCTHYNYLDLLPELSKNFQIILIDNRGLGNSDRTTSDYSLKDVALDALAVMEALNINSFGLMGISMGGFIAQEIMKIAPEKVKALGLMCTLSSGSDFTQPIRITEVGLRQFNLLAPNIQAEYSTIATVHPTLKEKNPTQYQRIIDLRIKYKADIEQNVRQNKAACAFLDSPMDLSFIQCPTLAMAGSEDRFVSPKNVEAFKKNIKGCQTALIPESDHFFFLEKPNEVASVLSKFFQEVL
jgi:pimeloyl-ACP methyl ester carboxylesterase